MQIIYIDCTAGISGGALLGALVGLGLDGERLIEELRQEMAASFDLTFSLSFQKIPRRAAIQTSLNFPEDRQTLAAGDFVKTFFPMKSIDGTLSSFCQRVLQQILAARSRLEGLPLEELAVCKIEAIKMLIIAGGVFTALGQMAFPRIVAAPLPLTLSPWEDAGEEALVLELAQGATVSRACNPDVFVTPMGVSILTLITGEYGALPGMRLGKTGYGAANDGGKGGGVRVLGGAALVEEEPSIGSTEKIMVIETGIDDMNPEFFPYIIEQLLANGALDAFLIPVYMKKGRPANLLKVLCKKTRLEEVLQIIFKESTTLGVRLHEETRRVLHRSFFKVPTPYGEVTVKAGFAGSGTEPLQLAPEFEDCKKAALKTGTPVKKVYGAAQRSALERIKEFKGEGRD